LLLSLIGSLNEAITTITPAKITVGIAECDPKTLGTAKGCLISRQQLPNYRKVSAIQLSIRTRQLRISRILCLGIARQQHA